MLQPYLAIARCFISERWRAGRLIAGAWLNNQDAVLHAKVNIKALKGHAVQLLVVSMIMGTRV